MIDGRDSCTETKETGGVLSALSRLVPCSAALLMLNSSCARPPASSPAGGTDPTAAERKRMVETQLMPAERGITNQRVLHAMLEIPRHEFVPDDVRKTAYEDGPLPIGHQQTISQPYIVALMTQALDPQPEHRVLEIGTGSGYQAAVLARLAGEVFTIEIVEPLARRAEETLKRQGLTNVHVRHGDGYQGWKEAAPFDSIIVTCAPDDVPEPLTQQLKEGGRMVIPVGEEGDQQLVLIEKKGGKLHRTGLLRVRFVPMTGKARE